MKFLRIMASLSMSRIVIFGVLCTVMYYTTYFDDGSVLETQIATMNSQVKTESARRIEVNKTIKKEEEMRGNLLQLQRNLEVVKSKIPNEFSDTQMSIILNNASIASGVNLQDLSVVASANNVAGVKKVYDPNSIKPEDLIEEVRFNITLSGSYGAFLKFLDVLTKEDKVLKVKNFVIEKNSSDIDDDMIKFKGDVVGFKQSSFLSAPGVK